MQAGGPRRPLQGRKPSALWTGLGTGVLRPDLGVAGGNCGQQGLCIVPTYVPAVPLSGSGGPPHNRTIVNSQLDYCRVLYLGLP